MNLSYFPSQTLEVGRNFISDDTWAPYVISYQGERIIREKLGDPPRIKLFRKLTTEKTIPSDLQ
jgi:hypothetical protein